MLCEEEGVDIVKDDLNRYSLYGGIQHPRIENPVMTTPGKGFLNEMPSYSSPIYVKN